jgi:hypothetical protein
MSVLERIPINLNRLLTRPTTRLSHFLVANRCPLRGKMLSKA